MPTIFVRHLLDPLRSAPTPRLSDRAVCGLRRGAAEPFLVVERQDDEAHPVTCRACLRGLEARARGARSSR